MANRYIDLDLTKSILRDINSGYYDDVKPVEVGSIPGVNGNDIIDRAGMENWSTDLNTACDNLRKINPELREYLLGTVYGKIAEAEDCRMISFSTFDLEQIGIQLYPYVSYGILNGGSATSYTDVKKNEALNPELMKLYRSLFEKAAEKSEGKAKGITPAFTNPDGSSGPSFMELKLRALLIENIRYRMNVDSENELFSGDAEKRKTEALFPMFQMTSVYNDHQIAKELDKYRGSPFISDLIETSNVDITKVLSGVQPMIAAITHSSVGKPRQIFSNAWGRDGEMLPLPGGHGQNFLILSEIYRYLNRDLGKKFVYLGNVDNLGNMPDPVSLAVTALSGAQASFEFAFRTPVDVKGGILVREKNGHLNCADIGPAVSPEEVAAQENSGKRILYNCATGLFNLDYLSGNIEHISRKLPMRVTDQHKDSGMYAQAEQITWEIIGMLDSPLILGVNKYERYLAAKLLLESFLTSGLRLEDKAFPSHEDPAKDFKRTAANLYEGLKLNLRNTYGMREEAGTWVPLPASEIEKILRRN